VIYLESLADEDLQVGPLPAPAGLEVTWPAVHVGPRARAPSWGRQGPARARLARHAGQSPVGRRARAGVHGRPAGRWTTV